MVAKKNNSVAKNKKKSEGEHTSWRITRLEKTWRGGHFMSYYTKG